MPALPTLLAFSLAALLLLLTPGPGVLYVVTRSLSQGPRAGLTSAAGLATGVLVHIGAAAGGVSALVLASAAAFAAVKTLGALYLIWLGIRAFRARAPSPLATAQPRAGHRLYLDGILVSALNPKLALFFLAFLPQFVDPRVGPVSAQLLVLGLTYVGLALITDSGYALLASHLGQTLLGTGNHQRWPRYLAGTVYIGLGVATALTGPPT